MTSFILNNKTLKTSASEGMTLLDFIRNEQHLKGTKSGCREGDCGACSILVGALQGDEVVYKSMTSCLMPLANATGKHIVTVEGINMNEALKINNENPLFLTPVQAAMHEEGATQCGFCTVGFVMSLTGLSLENKAVEYSDAIESIDGNICRCTGYKSIERAAQRLTNLLKTREVHGSALDFAIKNQIVPPYFREIKNRLLALNADNSADLSLENNPAIVGGGTDLYVQKHAQMPHTPSACLSGRQVFLLKNQDLTIEYPAKIILQNGFFEMSNAVTVSDMKASSALNGAFPFLQKQLKLVSSTPIRNMATIAGNLVNASPIGDMTIWFLASDATIFLQKLPTEGQNTCLPDRQAEGVIREIALKDFYKGYKTLAKTADEILTKIRFKNPEYGNTHFNFEKVCKRTYLDIASVNTAIFLETNKENSIVKVGVSIGGVAPIPLFLTKTTAFLKGKKIVYGEKVAWFKEANRVLQSEINPISDVRGSADYKRLLATQLFKAHFVELFATTDFTD